MSVFLRTLKSAKDYNTFILSRIDWFFGLFHHFCLKIIDFVEDIHYIMSIRANFIFSGNI